MSTRDLYTLFGLMPFTPEHASAVGLSPAELRALVDSGRVVEQPSLFGEHAEFTVAIDAELV